jgi:hypothetical protein
VKNLKISMWKICLDGCVLGCLIGGVWMARRRHGTELRHQRLRALLVEPST